MKYWNETLAVAQRILIELIRRQRSLIFWMVFPVSILIINGYILAERSKLSLDDAFTNAAPMTLVGSALFFSCLGGSVATVVAEREQFTLKRLFISPLSGVSYFLGIFLAHTVIGIGQTLIVYGTTSWYGGEFKGNLGLGIMIVLLSILAYVGVGFIVGTQLARRTEDVTAIIAAVGVPLLILGGAFLPASLFPEALLNIAKFNPIYHMTEALNDVSANGKTIKDIEDHLNFLILFAITMVIGGWISYQIMVQVEKQL